MTVDMFPFSAIMCFLACATGRYFILETEFEEFVLAELKSIFKNRISKREILESAKGETIKVELDSLQQQKARLMKYQEDSKEILAAIDDFIVNEILSKTTIYKLINRIETFADRSVKLYANFSCE
jgi:phosphoglycerate-specific signal transduction histidine kinase